MLLKIKICREGKSILLQNIWTLHDPIQAEGSDTPAVIKDANHVIEITVPYEPVGTENERFSFIAQLRLLPDMYLKYRKEIFFPALIWK